MKNIALITGASSGIGKELAKIHAQKGGDLILVARSRDKLQKLKADLEEKYKIQAEVISMDLTAPDSGKKLYDSVKQKNIEIDILVNNAGFGGQGYFHKRKWEDDKNMIELNVMTLVELTRFFLDDMVTKKSGKILNVSSTASFLPGPLQATYYASKAFVQSFSNALSRELQGTGVTVTNLIPGPVDTGFEKAANLENTDLLKGAVSAQSVAKDGYHGMMKGKIDVISGLGLMRRILFFFIAFIPKKTILNMVFDLQKKKK